MKEQQEEKKEVIDEEEEPADIFIGKDIIESYNYFHHYTSTNSKQEYYRLCQSILFGKELLPFDLVDEADRNKIESLHKEACSILENEILAKPTQKYQWADPASKSFPVYCLSADDSGSVSCVQSEYVEAVRFFRESQYDQHIKKLRSVENKIFHVLAVYGIIPTAKPSLEGMIEDKMVEKYEKFYSGADA